MPQRPQTKPKPKAARRRNAGGRPPKFDEPRRVVTVTLPERTLRRLAAIGPDLARAVVKVTDASLANGDRPRPPVEVLEVASGISVIAVGPSRYLRRIPWLKMIEIVPNRFLLTIIPGTPIESLEIALLDLLENVPRDDEYERQVLNALRRRVSTLRRDRAIWKAELLFVGGTKHRFAT